MKFSGVITIDKSNVHARGQGQRSKVKVTGDKKSPILTQIGRFRTEFTNGYEMTHKAWSNLGDVPYCISLSSVKFQGHAALKIVKFDPNWAFPDYNSSLNSPMATKWCTKLEVA